MSHTVIAQVRNYTSYFFAGFDGQTATWSKDVLDAKTFKNRPNAEAFIIGDLAPRKDLMVVIINTDG